MLSEEVDESTLKEIRGRPSRFVEVVLDKDPFEYQKDFLDSEAKKVVFVAGRQVGKSTSIAWKGIHEFATNKDRNILFVAPTQRQAVELFHEKLKAEIPEWVDNPDQYGLSEVTKTEIRGVNGSRMKALPAANKGETIRVFTADTVIVDEAAFIEDEVFTSVLIPMLLTTSGQFILAGTPWGKQGYFHKKFQQARDVSSDWDYLRVQTMESPKADIDLIKELKEDLTENEYKREVLAQFASPGNAALPEDLIKECIFRGHDSNHSAFPQKRGAKCYLGVDVATGGKSRAVFTSLDENGAVFSIEDELAEATIPQIETKTHALHRNHNYNAIRFDLTGLGEGPVSNLQDSIKVLEGVRFTLNSKQAMYNTLKKSMEEDEIIIPDYDPLLRELRHMELSYTPRGKTKIQPPQGASDDYFDSLMLAVDAMAGGSKAPAATGVYTLDGGRDSRRNTDSKDPRKSRERNRKPRGSWTF